MFGGEQPPVNNFRVLALQAMYFASTGRTDLARSVAADALSFAEKTAQNSQGRDLGHAMAELIAHDGGPAPVLKRLWGFGSRSFKVQSGAMAVVLLVAAAAIIGASRTSAWTAAHRHPPAGGPVVALGTQGIEAAKPGTRATRDAIADVIAATPPLFNEPERALPPTGVMKRLWGRSAGVALAPLMVVTANGSPSYYVKVVDSKRGTPVLLLFVRSGETASVRVPIGRYEMRFAAGERWYGEKYRFGPRTAYRKAEESFDFRVEGSEALGFTVTLVKQLNGNLREVAINPSDF
jgi:hypothetical protein